MNGIAKHNEFTSNFILDIWQKQADIYGMKRIGNEIQPANEAGRLIRATEAATLLGVSAQLLNYWRCKKKGPPYIKVGGSVRYQIADINAYIAERRRLGKGEDANA